MANLDHREAFANRLRGLRSTAGLSLEEASGRGGLSPNFWGSVERNEKEPCLDTICSLAKGLGITPDEGPIASLSVSRPSKSSTPEP